MLSEKRIDMMSHWKTSFITGNASSLLHFSCNFSPLYKYNLCVGPCTSLMGDLDSPNPSKRRAYLSESLDCTDCTGLAQWGHFNTKRTGQGVDDESAARWTGIRNVKEALTSEDLEDSTGAAHSAHLRHSSTRSTGFASNSFEFQHFYFDKIC